MNDEFKSQFQKGYGRLRRVLPDYDRCAAEVWDNFGSAQCKRKSGHGPHGAWCKQHDPIAKAAKYEKRRAEWRKKWDSEARMSKFRAACIDAVEKIAAGHNDPRGLAVAIIAAREQVDAAKEQSETKP